MLARERLPEIAATLSWEAAGSFQPLGQGSLREKGKVYRRARLKVYKRPNVIRIALARTPNVALWQLPMTDWMIARHVPRMEERVQKILSVRGITSYVPRYRASLPERIRRDQFGRYYQTTRRDQLYRPLYPTYMFVKTAPIYSVLEVEGVIGLVLSHDGCAAGSERLDKFIARLIASHDKEGLVPAPLVYRLERFKKGQKVRVLCGMFRDFGLGVYQSMKGDHARVLFELLGKDVGVVVNERDLAAA